RYTTLFRSHRAVRIEHIARQWKRLRHGAAACRGAARATRAAREEFRARDALPGHGWIRDQRWQIDGIATHARMEWNDRAEAAAEGGGFTARGGVRGGEVEARVCLEVIAEGVSPTTEKRIGVAGICQPASIVNAVHRRNTWLAGKRSGACHAIARGGAGWRCERAGQLVGVIRRARGRTV